MHQVAGPVLGPVRQKDPAAPGVPMECLRWTAHEAASHLKTMPLVAVFTSPDLARSATGRQRYCEGAHSLRTNVYPLRSTPPFSVHNMRASFEVLICKDATRLGEEAPAEEHNLFRLPAGRA
jgi:hypothetical protein